ncbi:MAG TPA: DegQ family serine endoprotease [Pyrinomonadaceae bacterium]|jgi:Do/DeqQ family serine protease
MITSGLIILSRRIITGVNRLMLSTVLIFSLAACKGQASTTQPYAPPVTENSINSNAAPLAQNSYAEVVSRVSPSVVTIRSERRVREASQFPFFDDPFFREFFGDRFRNAQPRPQERRERGLGSGVIVSADGHILTNHHVVDGAEEIRVELNDNRSLAAKVIGSDPPSDLAVLKVDAQGLPVLPLGDSDRVRVGDIVLAVGNPLGVGQTVTMGIISAKGRSTGLSDGSFEDFLQTDAPINTGNSGGALVNTNGELVGINSQILSPSGGNIGIGFAIPANMARSVMDQLLKGGKVRRGMLGLTIQSVTADLASSLGLPNVRGALVSSVQPGSPAERAGVRRGDVITAFNGAPVSDSNSLRNQVARTQPGTEVTLTVSRDNRDQQVHATLGELPADKNRVATGDNGGGATDTGKLGVSVELLTPALASRLDLPSGAQGLVVTNVDPIGPAAEAGVREGDLIEEVNRQPVRSVTDLQTAIQRTGTRPALLLINRRGQSLFLTVRPRQ